MLIMLIFSAFSAWTRQRKGERFFNVDPYLQARSLIQCIQIVLIVHTNRILYEYIVNALSYLL